MPGIPMCFQELIIVHNEETIITNFIVIKGALCIAQRGKKYAFYLLFLYVGNNELHVFKTFCPLTTRKKRIKTGFINNLAPDINRF
jgi:hypothetical protein